MPASYAVSITKYELATIHPLQLAEEYRVSLSFVVKQRAAKNVRYTGPRKPGSGGKIRYHWDRIDLTKSTRENQLLVGKVKGKLASMFWVSKQVKLARLAANPPPPEKAAKKKKISARRHPPLPQAGGLGAREL